MVPDFVPFYAVIIVLFSLLYFSFASIPFLFVQLDVPEVAFLFRGLFKAYFRMVMVAGFLAAVAFALSGHPIFTIGMLVLACGAIAVRGWALPRITAQQDASQAGDKLALRRLRQVHWASMAANALVVALVGSSVSYFA